MKVKKIIKRLRELIFDFYEHYPTCGKTLVIGWGVLHKTKFLLKKTFFKARNKLEFGSSEIKLNKILWVNPKNILFKLKTDISNNSSVILDGNWDLLVENIESMPIYQAFKQRFHENQEWDKIKHLNQVKNQISNGEEVIGCRNIEDFNKKLEDLEILYKKLENTNDSLKEIYVLNNNDIGSPAKIDEISVVINRKGHFILLGGEFGFFIVQLLGIAKVPVRIVCRHKQWAEFKRTMYHFTNNYKDKKIYQRLTHPDLEDIPYKYGDERFNLIKANLSTKQGKLLDIGSNLGYFCRKFEDEGFECYATETNQLYVEFLKKLRDAEHKKFKVFPKSIFLFRKDEELEYDIILAIFIFHHFIVRKNTFENLKKLLGRIKTKELYFGVHSYDEYKNNKHIYMNFNQEQFVNFILENSCLNHAERLILYENGRALYKLTSTN